MFEFDFLSELTLLEHPKKDSSGDILFATYYHIGDNYNVYAMANDLPELMTYNDATKYIKKLNKKTNKEWFIPHKELLLQMYDLRNAGDFAGTFTTIESTTNHDSDNPLWYWSSTENSGNSDYVYDVDFTFGVASWYHKVFCRLSSRPCRVELVS